MFARLTGTVDHLDEGGVILDVNGVGYLVVCSARTRARLNRGEVARLFIETQVREDAINLYGFLDSQEQVWFKLLTTVQGVGARVGMSILSTLAPQEMTLAIAAQDKAMFTRAEGVGPKLGVRIVTELKDKVPDFAASDFPAAHVVPGAKSVTRGTRREENDFPAAAQGDADAISALVNLGYTRAEAFSAVIKARAQDPAGKVGDWIRLALNELSRNVA